MGLAETLQKDGFITTTIDSVVKLAQKNSLWPMPLGLSCCGIEMMGVAASRFDIARFGSEVFRMTPRQSDFLLCAGTVTYKMAWVVRKIYDQMPDPKWVMAMGVCASTGGMFRSYPVVQGIDEFLPVDIYIAGCPPRPEGILKGLMLLQEKVGKYKPTVFNLGKNISPMPNPKPFESELTKIEI